MSLPGQGSLFSLIAGALLYLSWSSAVFACASCGGNGDDPLILYPHEHLKLYIGGSQSDRFANINPDGTRATAGGPERKQKLLTAFGYSLSPRSFITLTVPYMRNLLGSDSRVSVGDPTIGGRYTLLMQSIDRPYTPQLQLIYGYKHAYARSMHESKHLATQLDVFGSGFSTIKFGADMWFGMLPVKPGVAFLVFKPLDRRFNGAKYSPGVVTQSIASLGYDWLLGLRTTAGMIRETHSRLKVDGETQADSEQLNHSLFVNIDWMITLSDALRVSYQQQAAAFRNVNTTRSRTLGVAYMRSI